MNKQRLHALLICAGLGVFAFIYFQYFSNKSYTRIPVIMFSPLGVPLIQAEIEEIQYACELDLGSSFELKLQPKTLKKLKNKTKESNKKVLDIRNNLYETQSFRIPVIRLKNWEIKNLLAIQEIKAYTENTMFYFSSETEKKTLLKQMAKIKQGTIGCPVFYPFACFFDFSHSEIVIGKDMAALSKAGCCTKQLIKVPFDFIEGKILFSVTTDIGTHSLLLDTGATCSMIRQSLALSLAPKDTIQEIEPDVREYTSHSCIGNQVDLGRCSFRLFEMSDAIDYFDGALGMDFLHKHSIILDFPNQTA